MEDITKTGPKGLKGLPGLNKKEQMDELIRKDRESRSSGNITPESVLSQYQASPIENVGIDLMNKGYGNSRYDSGAVSESQIADLNEFRAGEQGFFTQVASGLAKGVLLAGTTFLDGTIGLLVGGVTAAKEKRWSALWDNEFSRAMQSFNDWSEEVLPNYYSKEELEDPWYKHILSGNFIGDKFIKNLGFTVGAFYSGGVEALGMKALGKLAFASAKRLGASISTLKNVTKASSFTASALGALGSAVNEGRIEALNNSRDWYNLQKQTIDDEYNDKRAMYEALGDYDSLVKLNEGYQKTMTELEEDRQRMGNMDLIMNIPILTASNLYQFGKLYANGFRTGRRASNIVGSITEGYKGGTTRAAGVRKAIGNSLSEGTEEITQKMASTISGDYYEDSISNYYNAKTNPEAEQRTVNWIKSFAQGINETVNEGSSWEEFFIGALTGALGMPMFRGARSKDGKFRSPVTFQGGILGELRENKEQMEREARIADYMNQRVQDPKFKDYYQGLIRHDFYQEQMDEAVRQGNDFDFKNAEFAQFLSDINMFDNAGKLEDLTTLINSAFDTSDENLQSIVNNTTNVITAEQQTAQINETIAVLQDLANKAMAEGDTENLNYANSEIQKLSVALSNVKDVFIGSFTNKDGSPVFSTEKGKKDMIEKLTQTRNEMLSQIDNYVKTKMDILDSVGESINDDQLSELIFLKTQVDNWQDRAKSMTNDIMDILKEASAVFRTIHNPNDKETDYSKTIENINDLLSKTPEEVTSILTNPKNQGFVDALGLTLSTFGGSNINGLDKAKVLDKLNDLKKIGTAIEVYNKKFEEYLKNPSKQAERQAEETQQRQKDQETTNRLNLRDKVNNSSVSDLVSMIDDGSLDMDEMDSMLSELEGEGAEDTQRKGNDVKDVINTYSDAVADLDKRLADGEITQQQRDDAVAMLTSSRSKAENGEELLDVDGESFNDFRQLNMEDDASAINERAQAEGWSDEDIAQALDDIRNKRMDDARTVVRSFSDERKARNEALNRLPEGTQETNPQPASSQPLPASPTPTVNNQTGHDSVDRNEPVNRQGNTQNTELTNSQMAERIVRKANLDPVRNKSIVKSINNILGYVDIALKKNMKEKDMKNLILSMQSWKELSKGGSKVIELTQKAINYKIKNKNNPVAENQNNQPSSNEDVQTPNLSVEVINGQIDKENNTPYDMSGVSKGPDGKYHYWRSGTTEFKIHRDKGDDSPYWTTMPASVRDIYKEIYEYLKTIGAFDRVRNNQVKEGDVINFAMSKELNEKTGVPVILICDEKWNVIGNLPIPNDSSFNDYAGLPEFYNKVIKQTESDTYKNSTGLYNIFGYQSKVSRNLIGKPQYTNPNERHTLNEINSVQSSDGSRKSVPFKLGIAIGNEGSNILRISSTPGRSRSQGASSMENTIQQPLSMVNGQPFLLMPTSSKRKAYVAVPIMMPVFDINNPKIANSALGQTIVNMVKELATISTNQDKLLKWADRFKELMAFEEVYVGVTGRSFGNNTSSSTFVVRVKNSKTDANWTTLFSGNQADCVDVVLSNLSNGNGIFNVNRKYINTTYQGRDYNSMIGELAETNLPIGATHTVNDWYTIDPIVGGKNEKAKNPKTTGKNPETREGSTVTVKDNKGNTYYLTSSNRLYKENPNGHDPELTDPKYNNIKAHAYGARIHADMRSPYQTPWGRYNPLTGKFEDVEEKPVAIPKIEGEVANQMRESSSKITFNAKDHTYTVNGQLVDTSVTQYVHGEVEAEAPGILGYLEVSGRIGTEVDTIMRNYFEGKVYNSPLFTTAQNRYVREQAKKLKDSLDTMFGKGTWKAITDENMLRVSGVIQTAEGLKTIAGTMDMLIQDKNGNFHIIDFKTKRSKVVTQHGVIGDQKIKYDNQISLYAALAQVNNPLLRGKITGSYLAIFNPFYPTPKGSRSNENGNITYTEQNGSIMATDWSLGGKVMHLHEASGFNPGTFNQLQLVTWNQSLSASVKGNIRSTRNSNQPQPQAQSQSQGESNNPSDLNSKSNAEIRVALDTLLERVANRLRRSDSWKDNIKQGLFTRYFRPEKAKPILKKDGSYFTIDDCVNGIRASVEEISRSEKEAEDFKKAMGPGYLGTADGLRGIGANQQIHYNNVSEYFALAYSLLNERESQSGTQSSNQSQQKFTEVKLPSGTQINLGTPSRLSGTDFYFRDDKVNDDEMRFKAVKTSKGIQFIPSISASNILSIDAIKDSMDVYTDISSTESSSSTIMKVVSLGEAKLENGRYIITKKPVVIISNNQDFIDRTLAKLNGNESKPDNQSSTEAKSVTQIYSKFEDAAIITKTYNGYQEVTDIQDWSRKADDIRKEPNGWGTHNGLTYYKRSIAGRGNDNITIWFRISLTEEGKRLIEQEFNGTTKVTEERKAKLLEIINNNQSTETPNQTSRLSAEEDTVGASPVALEYLLENGKGTIENIGYFLHAVAAAFPKSSISIEAVRNSAGSDILGRNASLMKNHQFIIDKLTGIVMKDYGTKGVELLNKLIDNSTGFIPSEGKKVSRELENLKPVNKPVEVAPAKPAVLNNSSREESINVLKSYDVINNDVRKAIIEKLSDDRLSSMASMKKLKVKQLLNRLDNIDIANDDINQAFDRITEDKPLNRVAEQEIQEANNWSIQSELNRIRKILPQLSMEGRIKLVRGLIRIAESNDPQYAYGQFQNGIITLSSEAARGTVYHEAFHFVTQALLSPEELRKLYESYGIAHSLNKSLEIEESMAEDFRRYMQSYEDGNFISNTFKTLKHIIKNLFGKSTTVDNLFYNIRRGKLANKVARQNIFNIDNIDTSIVDIEEITKPWKSDPTKNNKTLRIYLKNQHSKGYFELVKDNESNYYSVHLKTGNADTGETYGSTKEERNLLYKQLLNALPDGSYISTWGNISEGGIKALNKLGRSLSRVGERTVKDRQGNPINIPIFRKESNIPNILYRQAERNIEKNIRQMRIETQRFLDNFAITMQDVNEFGGQEQLFDALERIINIRNADDISEGTGYAVAFMMQHDDRIENLIKIRHKKEFDNIVNPILEAYKKKGKTYTGKKISLIPNEVKNRWLREIGNDVSYELKRLYNIEPIENKGFLSNIWNIIMDFFKKFTSENRNKLYAIQYTTKYIADAIKLNDSSMIVNNYIKPGTDKQAIKVDIEEALREYDFEREIIEAMYDRGIALAGSASIAIDGTLYRPKDNPLHDLDFNAVGYSKAHMDAIIKSIYKYHHSTQHIRSEFGKETVSYLVMDRPYYTEVFYDKDNNRGERIYDEKTKELLGYTLKSDLILKEGVKGKELDFFIGGNNMTYPNKVVNLNGRPYLISDYRAAFNAKITWAREKDMWDYNRFTPNGHSTVIDEIELERQKNLIRNAKIIWGHPAIGKTTYLEQNDDILEWDAEVNQKRNEFIRDQIDPEHKMDIESEEYKKLRKAYMGSEWKTHPEYIKFLTDEWENLKQRAYKEGKKLFASPAPLLEIGKDDFDLFINLPENVFLQRNMQRGGDLRGSLGWKKVINERLVDVDQSKIVTTDLYFSEFMKQNYGTEREQSKVIQQYHRQKLDYGNLNAEQRNYIDARGLTVEEYNSMTPQEKEVLFRCMY